MRTFLDSSAFAKRFVEESGSQKVETICANASVLGLSVICVPEIISALNRRLREKSITRKEYAEAKQGLLEDTRDADLVNLTPAVVALAVEVLEESPVRTTDALHIACAIEWGADLFVSSDRQQLRAAGKAELKTQLA